MKIPAKDERLPRSFYHRPTEVVARELLGKAIIRRLGQIFLGGFIVETEAYLAEGDRASHSSRGMTASNAAMFGKPGTLYVYPIHAKYCMNVVTDRPGKGSAVLIRAIEPVWGVEPMQRYRKTDRLRQLTRGPAMLCQSLQVNRRQDKMDLLHSDELWIAPGIRQVGSIVTTSRIGISSAADLPLRFFLDGNWFVSGRALEHRTRPTQHQRLLNTETTGNACLL
jgi:DNA-3-methyladenine glycosylase